MFSVSCKRTKTDWLVSWIEDSTAFPLYFYFINFHRHMSRETYVNMELLHGCLSHYSKYLFLKINKKYMK